MSSFAGAEEYEVIYDWEAENEDDLQIYRGDTVTVKEKNEHGWWFGFLQRDGKLYKGFFPKNYVKPKVKAVEPPRPPRRPPSNKPDTSTSKDIDTGGATESEGILKSTSISRLLVNQPQQEDQAFCLRSLKAYDELAEYGVALEINNYGNEMAIKDESTITNHSTVEIDCVASFWDGSKTVDTEFTRGVTSFTLGKDQQVPKGLEKAITQLKVGESATITCAPFMAYGAAGKPPLVAPDTYIIYRLKVVSATSSDEKELESAVGNTDILGSGVATRRTKAQVTMKASNHNVVLGEEA